MTPSPIVLSEEWFDKLQLDELEDSEFHNFLDEVLTDVHPFE